MIQIQKKSHFLPFIFQKERKLLRSNYKLLLVINLVFISRVK
jgi:hypothetical protein